MNHKKKKISVTTGCFNAEANLQELYDRLIKVMQKLPEYDHEIIVADNCSSDGSRNILRRIAAQDKNFKVIFNSNDFGVARSGHNAFLQATGDAVVPLPSDLRDPPEMIVELVRQWMNGNDVIVAVKSGSLENALMRGGRKLYYGFLAKFSEANPVIQHFTGFGLYDRKFMEAVKKYHDPYPYFRGLVSEVGFKRTSIPYVQDKRRHGATKSSFLALFYVGMNGFVNHSKLPLRLASFFGFCLAGMSLLVAFGYLFYKLLYWQTFTLGLAPLVIGFFFFSAVQLIFIGVVGEYVGAVLTQVRNRPLIIEDEKINFDQNG